jgi:hypothetical protein
MCRSSCSIWLEKDWVGKVRSVLTFQQFHRLRSLRDVHTCGYHIFCLHRACITAEGACCSPKTRRSSHSFTFFTVHVLLLVHPSPQGLLFCLCLPSPSHITLPTLPLTHHPPPSFHHPFPLTSVHTKGLGKRARLQVAFDPSSTHRHFCPWTRPGKQLSNLSLASLPPCLLLPPPSPPFPLPSIGLPASFGCFRVQLIQDVEPSVAASPSSAALVAATIRRLLR